jgi:hypothetical protein
MKADFFLPTDSTGWVLLFERAKMEPPLVKRAANAPTHMVSASRCLPWRENPKDWPAPS